MRTNARIVIEYEHAQPQIVAQFAHIGNACECAQAYNPGPYASAVVVETIMDGNWTAFYGRQIVHNKQPEQV